MAQQGNRPEAQLGCDFVLKLDPQFVPAERLKEALQTGEGPVDTSTAEAAMAAGSAAVAEVPEPSGPASDTSEAASTELIDFGLDDLDLSEPPSLSPDAGLQSAVSGELPNLQAADSLLSPIDELGSIESPQSDLDLGSSSVDPESQQRIAGLLAEGQESFDRNAYQEAIDAWSRIFLIDIENTEASRRIELARKLRAESERKIDEAYHEGVSKLEEGQIEEAKAIFQQVLEKEPNHGAAREHLSVIEQGGTPRPKPDQPIETGGPGPIPGLETAEEDALKLDEDLLSLGDADDLAGPADIPELPDEDPLADLEAPVVDSPPPPPKVGKGASRRFLMIGSAVLLAVVLIGGYLFLKRDSLFTNSDDRSESAAQNRTHPVDRAQELYDEEKSKKAIALLEKLPADDPRHDEAQSLIAQWSAPVEEVAEVEPESLELSEERLAYRQQLVEQARQALGNRTHVVAERKLREAASILPLDGEELELREAVIVGLSPVDKQLGLFRDGEWEYALPDLWRMREAEPGNPDVEQLIVDSYYNLSVRDLQRGDTESAVRNLTEAGDLHPQDPSLQRLIDFAKTYQARSQDLLYRIYVKYLPFR